MAQVMASFSATAPAAKATGRCTTPRRTLPVPFRPAKTVAMRTRCHITQYEKVRRVWDALCVFQWTPLLLMHNNHMKALGHIMIDATCFTRTAVQKGAERVVLRPTCRYFSLRSHRRPWVLSLLLSSHCQVRSMHFHGPISLCFNKFSPGHQQLISCCTGPAVAEDLETVLEKAVPEVEEAISNLTSPQLQETIAEELSVRRICES